MEHPYTLLTALGVVEWHGALRHLEAMRTGGELEATDTLIDVVTGELDHRARQWWGLRHRDTPGSHVTLDDIEADARAYLTENVDDLNALLAERI